MLQQKFNLFIFTLCSVVDYTAGTNWPYCSQNPSPKYHAAPIGMDVDITKKAIFCLANPKRLREKAQANHSHL